jgi:hypothetical protein
MSDNKSFEKWLKKTPPIASRGLAIHFHEGIAI